MATVINAELIEDLVELVVNRDGDGALNHVRTQIDPFLVVLFDHIQDHRFSISFIRVNIYLEIPPGQKLVLRGGREAILLVVIKSELVDGATWSHVFGSQINIILTGGCILGQKRLPWLLEFFLFTV